MNDMSVADVLRGAIDVLEQRGWHQGGYVGIDNSVCVLGAMGVACGLPADWRGMWKSNASTALLKADQFLYRRVGGVGSWNDDPERTYEDVVLALKHAAADAEARS